MKPGGTQDYDLTPDPEEKGGKPFQLEMREKGRKEFRSGHCDRPVRVKTPDGDASGDGNTETGLEDPRAGARLPHSSKAGLQNCKLLKEDSRFTCHF